jgi:adenine specific DNA methylase Mod
LIYCDILYNSGKRFRDYNDDLGSPAEAVEWYRPRFIEMRRVLTNNGSIFIHCNWRLDSYIRVLMDEIFGINCFRNRISRRHSKERYFFANFDSQMDCILYYVKDAKNFVFNETRDSTERVAPLFEIGYIEARSKAYNLSGKSIDLSSKNMHWLISEEQFNIMVSDNEVQLINGLPYRFSNVKPIGNLWDEPEMLDTYMRTELGEAYDTPKPEAILERIISTCSKEGDTVADFFMGGGTTAVVAKRLNRVGIFCDISSKACEVTVKKLSNAK